MSQGAHQPYSPPVAGWGKRGIGDVPAALLPAPCAGRVPPWAQHDTQQYSRRQVGLGVQWPLDWQALAGSPSSRNPGRQLYRTTEPTHQSLPYTTELKSASGRPQFTGDREVLEGSAGLAPCAACLAEWQPKEMHTHKVAGPGRGPGCWAGSAGALAASSRGPRTGPKRLRAHASSTKPALPRMAVPSLQPSPGPPPVSPLWLYLGRRTCSPASSSCRSRTGSSSAPCASPCSPPSRWALSQTSKYPGLLVPQGVRQSRAGLRQGAEDHLPTSCPALRDP